MIGLGIRQEVREGAALARFVQMVVRGDSVVNELLAAIDRLEDAEIAHRAKLQDMEKASRERCEEAEKGVLAAWAKSEKIIQDADEKVKAQRARFDSEVEEARKDISTKRSEVNQADMVVQDLARRVAEDRQAVENQQRTAEELMTNAIALKNKYEAWQSRVDAMKV